MGRLRTVRRFCSSAARFAVIGCVLAMLISTIARSDEPARRPRRGIPGRGLIAYLEHDGLDAHADAWNATAVHDMLVTTPTGAMLADMVRRFTDDCLEGLFGNDIMSLHDLIIQLAEAEQLPLTGPRL